MSDSRVDILTAHYVKENSHPQYASNEDDFAEAQFEAQWTIADFEAAGLVVADLDAIDHAALSRAARNAYIDAATLPLNNKWTSVVDAILATLRDAR